MQCLLSALKAFHIIPLIISLLVARSMNESIKVCPEEEIKFEGKPYHVPHIFSEGQDSNTPQFGEKLRTKGRKDA